MSANYVYECNRNEARKILESLNLSHARLPRYQRALWTGSEMYRAMGIAHAIKIEGLGCQRYRVFVWNNNSAAIPACR